MTNRVLIDDAGLMYAECAVVGCNYEALKFAEDNNLPIVYCEHEPPHFFDEESVEQFSELCFYLSLQGLVPFGEMIDSMRIHPEDFTLELTMGVKKYTMLYEKLYIFSDKNLKGLPTPTKKNTNFKVLDWLDVTSCSGNFNTIKTEDDFVNSIHFYPSFRTSRDGFSDAVSVSYMTEDDLGDDSKCDTYARLKSINLMSSAGITGTKMGSGRFRPLQVSHSHREVIPLEQNEYEELPGLEFR